MSYELDLWDLAWDAYGGVFRLLAGLLAINLVLVGVAIVAAPRLRSRAEKAIVLGPTSVLTLSLTAMLAKLVDAFRLGTLEWLAWGRPGDWEDPGPAYAEGRALTLLAVALVLVVPGCVLAFSRLTTRWRGVLRGTGLVALSVGVGATGMLVALHDPTPCLCLSQAAHFAEITTRFDGFAWGPALAAAAAFGALVVHRWRRAATGRPVAPPALRTTALAVAVAALGLGCAIASQRFAEDRHAPISLVGDALPPETPPRPATLPLERCRDTDVAPVLVITEDRVRLDNRRMDEETLAMDLGTLRRNWSMLAPNDAFPGRIRIVAPLSTPWPRLEPWLAIAHDAGYVHARFLLDRPHTVHTQPRGDIVLRAGCVVPVELSPFVDSADYPRYSPGPFASERWPTLADAVEEHAEHDLGYAYLRSITAAW